MSEVHSEAPACLYSMVVLYLVLFINFPHRHFCCCRAAAFVLEMKLHHPVPRTLNPTGPLLTIQTESGAGS